MSVDYNLRDDELIQLSDNCQKPLSRKEREEVFMSDYSAIKGNGISIATQLDKYQLPPCLRDMGHDYHRLNKCKSEAAIQRFSWLTVRLSST